MSVAIRNTVHRAHARPADGPRADGPADGRSAGRRTVGVRASVPDHVVSMRRARHRSDLIFEVLLGAAACLCLVAVVDRAASDHPIQSTDAPPPAVFVQGD